MAEDDRLLSLQATLAPRYRVERELGRGGMALVYLAEDTKFGRRVAIKVLRPELAATIATSRFFREIEFTARLNHPHILPLIDSGQAGDVLFYVMPYVEGESLRMRLAREKQLPIAEALRIAREVADALESAHRHGIVHRDITPGNILLQGGHAQVSDFGIARAISEAGGEPLTGTGVTIGTPGYMSPEQAAGEEQLDGRSDVFSLGCVLYEMLTGEPPYTGPSPQAILAKQLALAAPSATTVRATVTRALDAVLARALARVPADRFLSAATFSDALAEAMDESYAPLRPRAWRLRRHWAWTAVLAGAALLVVRSFLPPSPTLDTALVAVAPFDVYDPNLSLWREGFMDILSANLDGAGPLRSVSPTVVLRRWAGRADRPSAIALAKATHARHVIVGRVLAAGPDSMRVTATLLDAQTGDERSTIDLREAVDRTHLLGDALSRHFLRRLGQSMNPQTRQTTFGTTSLAALKPFLRGEYFLRRTQWDSAAAAYADAIANDSSFTLAYWRMKTARWSQSWGPDTAGDAFALEAGRRNHGLAPRESLLITVDSLWASLTSEDAGAWRRMRRLAATLDEAARRYPDDPWIWYKIGEARWHLPIGLDYPLEEHLRAFDRAIELDSGFALAYVTHPIELALILHGPERALLYTRGYQLVALPGVEDSAAWLTGRLLHNAVAGSTNAVRLPEHASADVLYRVAANLDMWFDSAETAVQVARQLAAQHGGSERFLDRETVQLRLAGILAVRGHLRDAWTELRRFTDFNRPVPETVEIFTDLALLGAVPVAGADSVFVQWMETSPRATVFALPWWTQRGDTAALRRATIAFRRWSTAPDKAGLARYGLLAVTAYSALARRDTVAARAGFVRLADSLCADCYFDWRTHAELLMAADDLPGARRQLERVRTYAWNVPTYPLASLLLGRIAERSNDVRTARQFYRTVINAWVRCDASLKPYVDQARTALARLRG